MSHNMRAVDSISFLSDVEALVEGAKQCLESELVVIYSNDICQILDCHAPLTSLTEAERQNATGEPPSSLFTHKYLPPSALLSRMLWNQPGNYFDNIDPDFPLVKLKLIPSLPAYHTQAFKSAFVTISVTKKSSRSRWILTQFCQPPSFSSQAMMVPVCYSLNLFLRNEFTILL